MFRGASTSDGFELGEADNIEFLTFSDQTNPNFAKQLL
jgi:hypothetical protein